MLLKYAKPGYPNTKKGRKMQQKDNLVKKPKVKNFGLKLIVIYATILTILKSH